MKFKRNYYIDAQRVILSLIVAFHHIFRSEVLDISKNPHLEALHYTTIRANSLLEFFFIAGGFFLYQEIKNTDSIIKQIFNKIIRLWPVLFISSIIEFCFTGFKYNTLLVRIFFLQCIGFFSEYKTVSWFASTFFWATVFYIIFNQSQKDENKRLLTYIIIAYFGYVININVAGDFGRGVVLNFIDLSLFRALADMATGHILAHILEKIDLTKITKKSIIFLKVLMNASWIYPMFIWLIYDSIPYEPILVIVMVSIFIFCSQVISETSTAPGFIRFIASFSKYTYSLYLMHQSAYYITYALLKLTNTWTNDYAVVVKYFIAALIFGVASYYLIEQKGKKLMQKLLPIFK